MLTNVLSIFKLLHHKKHTIIARDTLPSVILVCLIDKANVLNINVSVQSIVKRLIVSYICTSTSLN